MASKKSPATPAKPPKGEGPKVEYHVAWGPALTEHEDGDTRMESTLNCYAKQGWRLTTAPTYHRPDPLGYLMPLLIFEREVR